MTPETLADLYLLFGAIIATAAGWAIVKGGKYLASKTKNETIGGIITRLSHSVSDAVDMVNQTTKKEILKAKDPDSDGGVKITKAEQDQLREAVWVSLKAEYGGMVGIMKFFGGLGISNTDRAKAKIDTMIEADVNRKKKML